MVYRQHPSRRVAGLARTDYAANGGDAYTDPATPYTNPLFPGKQFPLWPSVQAGYSGPSDVSQVENPPGVMTANARLTFANVASVDTGISSCGSMVRPRDVTDGLSNTYLLGEKNMNPDWYLTGQDSGDNEWATQGDAYDDLRFTGPNPWYVSTGPQPDTPGYSWCIDFGSAHLAGLNMAFCDGSVRMISYRIDQETHRRLCNRHDGLPIDGKKW